MLALKGSFVFVSFHWQFFKQKHPKSKERQKCLQSFLSQSFLSKANTNKNWTKHPYIIETYLWTVSLNFSSSKNCKIKNTSSLLKEDIAPGNPNRSSAKIGIQINCNFIWVLPEFLFGSEKVNNEMKNWRRRTYLFVHLSYICANFCIKPFIQQLFLNHQIRREPTSI